MPGAQLQPEDLVDFTQDPNNPQLFRFRVLLRDDLDPAVAEFLRSNSTYSEGGVTFSLNAEDPLDPQVQPAPPNPPPRRSTIKEAHLGPLEIKLDFGPFMKVLDRLHSGYQHLVEKLAGPELMQIIEDLTEHRRKPATDFEHMIARTLLGPTRFDRINEEDD